MKRVPASTTASGEINILLVPFIFLFLFFVAAAGFGLWAYTGREDYKSNTDQKIVAAVKVARQQQNDLDAKASAEADKQPLKTYDGPELYGGIHVSYPKTWSGYVNDTATASPYVDAYFEPNVVPSLGDQNSTFALRIQIVDQSYSSVVSGFSGQVSDKSVTATPFSYPKVSSVVGVRFDGAINSGKKLTGSIVVVPIRDKTLEIWTENTAYSTDFNNFVLPSVSFSP